MNSIYNEQALDFAKIRAAQSPMSPTELSNYIRETAEELRLAAEGPQEIEPTVQEQALAVNPKLAIKENTIACVVCGQKFKLLTSKHLASHGLTKESYCELAGYKKKTPLACKALQRARREKMQDMKLWERVDRTKGKEVKAPKPAPVAKVAAPKDVAKSAPVTDEKK